MPGPPPKNPATRQRRNKASTEAHFEDAKPIARTGVPRMPKNGGGKGGGWTPQARALWREIWQSPMRDEYIRADVHRIVIYVRLFDEFMRTGKLEVLAEIRLQGQCLGLTPIDRRRLGWVVSKAEPATKKEPPRRKPPGGPDPRTHLRAVQ